MTVSIPAFPPPEPADPDEVGWPMCTAAAYWRQGRYAEAIKEVEVAARAAGELGLVARRNELAMAGATLAMYVQSEDAEPSSVVVSHEYPSLEVMEELLKETTAAPEEKELASMPIATTLPSGIFGAGARNPKMRRLFPKPEQPLQLDFEGSFLRKKPTK